MKIPGITHPLKIMSINIKLAKFLWLTCVNQRGKDKEVQPEIKDKAKKKTSGPNGAENSSQIL